MTGIVREVFSAYSANCGNARLRVEETIAFPIRGLAGTHRQRLRTDLDRGVGVSLEVVVPGGVGRRACLGGEYHVAPAVLLVGNRIDALHAGLGAGVMQQQDRHTLEVAADASAVGAELVDDLCVEVSWRCGHGAPRTVAV